MSLDSFDPPHLSSVPPAADQLIREVEGLQAALKNRDIIGQAKGIVRLLIRCDADAAFAFLGRISQDTNRKVADVAAHIADSACGVQLPADISASWRRRATSGSLGQLDSQAS